MYPSPSVQDIWYKDLGRISVHLEMSRPDAQTQVGEPSWASCKVSWEMVHSQIERPSPNRRFPLRDRLALLSMTDGLGER